jgi:acetolactate synthase-1/2/3 large subunit
MILNGADIIIECLAEQGVDTVFGYPGGNVLNIYDSLYKQDRIRHILTSHEQHAGHAADGYARASGKTGVCIATSGPGATNLVTALATAQMDSIPVVAITGNVPRNLIGLDSFQEVNITGVVMPITKHSFLVRDVKELADTLRSAFFIANDGRKGVVLVDIPKDITAESCEFTPLPDENTRNKPFRRKFLNPDFDSQLLEAKNLIDESSRPFIYAGGGVIGAEASEELALFAEILDAPVSSSLMGQGGYDQCNSRYIGMLGMHGTTTAASTLRDCDLLIALGVRFSDRVIGDAALFSGERKIIHVDIDAAEHGKSVSPSVAVGGNIRDALKYLNAVVRRKNNADWRRSRARLYRGGNGGSLTQAASAEYPVTPEMILQKIGQVTEGRAVIVTEVGQSQIWAAMYYAYRYPRGFISSGGLGTMGFGLGAAIGTKLAHPEKLVVNIAGDGSFGMNMNELVTLARYNIPVVQVIFNNRSLGMVRQWQTLFYGKRYSQTNLGSFVDYIKLAEAFGIMGMQITKPEDAEPMLSTALVLNKPVIIECPIDPDLCVLPMTASGADLTKPLLNMEIES